MDRLEVLRLDHVGVDALVQVEHRGHVAHQVLDELGIVVGALGDELLVGPLEQAVELARALLLDDVDDLLDPHELVGARRHGHERWLCAPRSEILFEHGHRLVTGTTTFMVNRCSPLRTSPVNDS